MCKSRRPLDARTNARKLDMNRRLYCLPQPAHFVNTIPNGFDGAAEGD